MSLDEAIETTKDLIEESWDWERILEVPAIKSAIILIYMCLWFMIVSRRVTFWTTNCLILVSVQSL
jgi:hypothetical protein